MKAAFILGTAGCAVLAGWQARVPEVARLEALDEAGLRALTTALIPVAADPDKNASAGAREALVRVASRPGTPKDLLVPFFVGDMQATKMTPSNAAWCLAQLGEEGRAIGRPRRRPSSSPG